MVHEQRVFLVPEESKTPEELAELLTQHSWCLCNGFRVAGKYLILNDSFSEDGAQEFAIVLESTGAQIESITFSWCTQEKALEYLRAIADGCYDRECYGHVANRIETPKQHNRCRLCA